MYQRLLFALQTPMVGWGLLPVLCATTSYIVVSTALEWLARQPFMQHYLVVYPGDDTRPAQAAKIQSVDDSFSKKPMSISFQWKVALGVVAGPTAWLGGLAAWAIQQYVIFRTDLTAPERFAIPTSVAEFLWHFVLLALIADFFLYSGHRIQHQSDFLWHRFHSRHHQLATPTPTGTIFIEETDATLQASVPLLLANLIVQPQCLTWLLYVCFHVSNNVLNHSGINDCWWLDLITLKVLPFRTKNKHHDMHHKYGNRRVNAKNYSEMVVIWDYLFGTLSPV